LYDGATQDEIDSLDEESGIKYSPEVRVKIVDFAHAITDLHAVDVVSAPFPPQHPKNADKGYLKGLSSLKRYFKAYVPSKGDSVDDRIWKEVRGEEDMAEYIDSASRSHSSHYNHPPPIFKLDPFSTMNEVAVIDEKEENMTPPQSFEDEEDDWSDVSV
jgi:hypothetical protein